MAQILATLGWVLLGLILGITALGWPFRRQFILALAHRVNRSGKAEAPKPTIAQLIEEHFHPVPVADISIYERKFPFRVRADLQRAIDRLFHSSTTISHFCGVRRQYAHDGLALADCIVADDHHPPVSIPPQFEEVDVGDAEAVRCLKNGLWFLESNGIRYVVLLTAVGRYGQATGIAFHVGVINNADGTRVTQEFFQHLEESVLKAESYRGKILSLERAEHSYTGESTGIKVHKLRIVEREQVILPRQTLELLDRNVVEFAATRSQLAAFQQATKKGILFYGPPGTGKTHTIHYLARALPGHTTLLVTAEQVGLLDEYMSLARLLQPSIVVLEDVDLIARDRSAMGVCEELILNKLLNEMDGLREDADILFILTTNRPESLEAALASRPGRVDQAIEFPLPDAEGRQKLLRLYSRGIELDEDIVEGIVRRTDRVSAAFIKELMRRSVQFHLESNGNGRIRHEDVDKAIEEMLFSGGSLNLKLLGADEASVRGLN